MDDVTQVREWRRAAVQPTQGPWHWSANPHGGANVSAKGAGIADVLSRAGVLHPVQEHCEANARLIAAAPDLLEAAEEALMFTNSCSPVATLLRAAIAKARGQ